MQCDAGIQCWAFAHLLAGLTAVYGLAGRPAVAWLGCRARRRAVYFLTLPPTMPPAQAAAAAAEAERAQRAEAQGQSEQLRAESERRARVFNAAVQKAVSKIQQELEAERNALQQR